MINIWVGYDDRERVGYSVFCHSVLARTSRDVAFYPVRGTKVIGSTKFNPGRFEVARRMGYRGWAIWAECDMLCLADIGELMDLKDSRFDVLVCQSKYKTKHPVKFLDQPNPDYDRKNWSSLMLINCHGAWWERISQDERYTLQDMHRFADARVGVLPVEWNHLVGEYKPNPRAKIAHFTIGLPIWREYTNCEFAEAWRTEREAMLDFEPKAKQCAPETSDTV